MRRQAGRLRGLVESARRWLPRLPVRLRSFTARLALFVFGAALLSSLAVASTSTRAVEVFLRRKVEQKLPAILGATSGRLEVFFSQVVLDMKVFGGSAVIVEGLDRLRLPPTDPEHQQARAEAASYLTSVLERFPQYTTLSLRGREGRTLLSVGEDLSASKRDSKAFAAVGEVAFGPVVGSRVGWLQPVSAEIRSRAERNLGSLHALLHLEHLATLLASSEIGESGRILVVDAADRVLVGSPGAKRPERFHRIEASNQGAVQDYTAVDGTRVVGSSIPFSRFGWDLVVEESHEEAFAPIGPILRGTLALNLAIVLLLSLGAYRMATSIARPIRALSDCARRLADGETDVSVPVTGGRDEMGLLTQTFAEMTGRLGEARAELEQRRHEIEQANERLRSQNDELQRANEVLEQLAITDGLTRIHNHRFFQDQLTREIKRCERTEAPLSLVLIDIDDFKALNDRHGHATGDAVLQHLARVLVEETRDHDLTARYGGEEFAILAADTDLDGSLALAEKLRTAIAENEFTESGEEVRLQITVSMGIAVYRGDREAFFREADRALYDAKAGGKDCVVAAKPPRSRST